SPSAMTTVINSPPESISARRLSSGVYVKSTDPTKSGPVTYSLPLPKLRSAVETQPPRPTPSRTPPASSCRDEQASGATQPSAAGSPSGALSAGLVGAAGSEVSGAGVSGVAVPG